MALTPEAFEIGYGGILYVREQYIRRRSQVDRLRGTKVRGVVVMHDRSMPDSLRSYLDEVLDPIIDDARRLRGDEADRV